MPFPIIFDYCIYSLRELYKEHARISFFYFWLVSLRYSQYADMQFDIVIIVLTIY